MAGNWSKLERGNAWFGLAFSASLAVIETVHNWSDWSEPAFWIIDYFACFLLAGGAGLFLFRKDERGLALLGVGWGFACAMFWMAFFQIRRNSVQTPELADPLVLYVCFVLFLSTIVGLMVSLLLLQQKSSSSA
jgi:peptidoglycan/LPS O-acetylase OafA/YrhL